MATITGTSNNDNLVGGESADEMSGLAGNDTLAGLGGDDALSGSDGNDSLIGGAGNDTLIGSTGFDTLDGGAGIDTASYLLSSAGVIIQLQADGPTSGGDAGGDTLPGIENVVGSAFGDHLMGLNEFAVDNMLSGMGGNDTLQGAAGADTLLGGDGNDELDGTDPLYGGSSAPAADSMAGGAGDDFYRVEDATDIVVELAGEGFDRIDTPLAAYVMPAFVERLRFMPNESAPNRHGTGNDSDNDMIGLLGADTLRGGKGADTLHASEGDDVLEGGTGADMMIGGGGNDTYHYGQSDTIVEAADGGLDTVMSSIDITLGLNVENLTLTGTRAVIANGNNLDNVVNGNALANLLQGGNGEDTVSGFDGDDTIVGGKGQDVLTGGNGNDTFRFTNIRDSSVAAMDLITDLQAGDRLDFSIIDADATAAGDQAFVQVGAFSSQAGQVTATYDAGTNRTTVSLDATGDGLTDLSLQIVGQHTSAAGWVM